MGALINNRCIIVAAGEINNLDLLKSYIKSDDFIIAADGGYKKCLEIDLLPSLIVGDFDSSEFPTIETEIIALNPIKDSTDTETAISIGIDRGYDNFLIFGATGGRFDHSFANIASISNVKDKNVKCTLIDEHHKIYILKDECHKIQNKNQYVSIFAYGGECTVSLNGFFYKAKNYVLTPNLAIGVSNELNEDEGEIIVSDGKLLVIECEKFN